MARAFFANSITIPASTTWADPEVLVLDVPVGYIVQWFIHGAPEHQHQVSIAIYHQEHRVFPEGEVEVFYPSEYPAQFDVEQEMIAGIRRLVVLGANSDDTYPHTVYVGVMIEHEITKVSLLERVAGFFAPSEVVED